MTTRLAFLILSHSHFRELDALIGQLLSDLSSAVVVHVDSKAGDDYPQFLIEKYGKDRRFRLCTPRIRCHWGHHSLVDATCALIDTLEQSGLEYDYASLLSAQDWPIGPLSRMARFLDDQGAESEYLDIHDMFADRWIHHGYYKRRYSNYWPFRPIRYLNNVVATVNSILRIRRRPPSNWHPFSGSQWWTLTRSAVLTVSRIYNDEAVSKFYKNSFIPDEMVFQTILGNHEYLRHKIICNNLRYIKWEKLGTPTILVHSNFQEIKDVEDPVFFARKFEFLKSASLKNQLMEFYT